VGRGRIEAFSDGVFAVAITVLALNLAVAGPGHGSLARQLTDHWPSFVAFAISFFTIGIIWVNHHALFATLKAIDRPLVFWNLLLLFFVVSIPFATATMASYLRGGGPDAGLAMAVYEAVFAGMSLAFGVVFFYALSRHLLPVSDDPAERRTVTVRFLIGNAAYLIAIGVAFVSAGAALAISGLVAVYYIFERTPTPAEAEELGPG